MTNNLTLQGISKLFQYAFLCIFSVPAFFSCSDQVEVNSHSDDYRSLKKHFAELPDTFKPIVSWVWTSEITKTEIKDQLGDFALKGFGGVFIQPTNDVDYKSDLWDELIAYAEKIGKRYGVNLWCEATYMLAENSNILWFQYCQEDSLAGLPLEPDDATMYHRNLRPGIKIRFDKPGSPSPHLENTKDVRKLNSVGNQLGKVQKLAKTHGTAEWKLSFEDIKRNMDWLYALGVTHVSQQFSHKTSAGDMDNDFLQSFSYQLPAWEHYSLLNNYLGRLSYALTAGEQINKTLILDPATTTCLYDTLSEENKMVKTIDKNFSSLINRMECEQVEYDLGSEYLIKGHGAVEEGFFIIGDRKYQIVILPRYMENINNATLILLEKFLQQGGQVIALGNPPVFIDGVASSRCESWPDDYPDHYVSVSNMSDPLLLGSLRSNDFRVIELQGDSLFHMRRRLKDGQLLFFANSAIKNSASIRLNMIGKSIVEMDPLSGRITNYPCVLVEDLLSFKIELFPAESKLLFISERSVSGQPKLLSKWNGKGEIVPVTEIKTKILDDNVYNLDYCRLVTGSDTSDLIYYHDALNYKGKEYAENMLVKDSANIAELTDRERNIEDTAILAKFPFMVDSEFRTKDLRLVVKGEGLKQVKINNLILKNDIGDWKINKAYSVFRIKKGIFPGMNEVTIESNAGVSMNVPGPVFLVGDFDVLPIDKGWLLASSSSRTIGFWKSLGLPFFSGRATYSSTFHYEGNNPVKIVVPSWNGSVATVSINGFSAGAVFFPPYELRLDHFLVQGENRFSVTVYGSIKNLLGPHHKSRQNNEGHLEDHYPTEFQPSGMDYDLLNYGLKAPVEIYTLQK